MTLWLVLIIVGSAAMMLLLLVVITAVRNHRSIHDQRNMRHITGARKWWGRR